MHFGWDVKTLTSPVKYDETSTGEIMHSEGQSLLPFTVHYYRRTDAAKQHRRGAHLDHLVTWFSNGTARAASFPSLFPMLWMFGLRTMAAPPVTVGKNGERIICCCTMFRRGLVVHLVAMVLVRSSIAFGLHRTDSFFQNWNYPQDISVRKSAFRFIVLYR